MENRIMISPNTIIMEWIPVEFHEITDDEIADDLYPRDCAYVLDGKMPEDGQEILITCQDGEVYHDTCIEDYDGYYLESGYDWIQVRAWMPYPRAYKEE